MGNTQLVVSTKAPLGALDFVLSGVARARKLLRAWLLACARCEVAVASLQACWRFPMPSMESLQVCQVCLPSHQVIIVPQLQSLLAEDRLDAPAWP